MISVKATDLTKKFNNKIIFQGLSFEHRNGVFGIAGDNGSGKSTLLKCLAYLLRPNSGNIEWKKSEKLLSQKEMKSQLGYAAPYINLYAELTVAENLQFLKEARGNVSSEKDLFNLLKRCQILHLKDQLFGSLSTGQQQRTKLAAALVNDPDTLMLDEPGSNLDKDGHALVSSIIENEVSKGTLVIIASNDPDEISLCHHVLTVGKVIK
ncbi:ATP-binding cassette domain-containing protein [Gracilimonas sp. Q87]|uniref:ABC transporter ATP-binding protein n=1 Tax=Gracilimonas sp. Q87 TaxID=3384766 RepID=UPI0039841E0B